MKIKNIDVFGERPMKMAHFKITLSFGMHP
jgi:hypothetical protein